MGFMLIPERIKCSFPLHHFPQFNSNVKTIQNYVKNVQNSAKTSHLFIHHFTLSLTSMQPFIYNVVNSLPSLEIEVAGWYLSWRLLFLCTPCFLLMWYWLEGSANSIRTSQDNFSIEENTSILLVRIYWGLIQWTLHWFTRPCLFWGIYPDSDLLLV